MESLSWGFIGTIIGAVVGASASIFTSVIMASNARKLQLSAVSLERSEKAREFQRDNLLELQEALSYGMRLIGRAHLYDMEHFQKASENERVVLLPEELDQEIYNSSRQLSILTERIVNESLRKSIKRLRSLMTEVLMTRTEKDSLASINNAQTAYEDVMILLGKVLRDNY
ncbi:hypothetical protein [Vibrio alginolyticus]|uniref:hypothetical protein n=1 Tax=Vibrio alginolyticus TaxID=663 RepID=UPI00215D3414|nr:hypothetical protein [Vibrio alginolyticus]EKY4875663.1 hypothetical protein [Vibrio alginolyticus]MCR9338056.1 hypothetical protein [Vibrio alginolyticus]MCR9344261.1 hypothetical protein [Vibrio alginolyticus]MCR9439880.1 hypothetical protein [Vibrio alginolyticus]